MAPPNESCATAVVISALPYTDTVSGMVGFYVYYRFTPGSRLVVNASTTLGSYSQINIYTGDCADLTLLESCSSHVVDAETTDAPPQVIWILQAGVSYLFEVELDDHEGTFAVDAVSSGNPFFAVAGVRATSLYASGKTQTRRRYDPFVVNAEEIGPESGDPDSVIAFANDTNGMLWQLSSPNAGGFVVRQITPTSGAVSLEWSIDPTLQFSGTNNVLKIDRVSGDVFIQAWKGGTLGGINRYTTDGTLVTTYGDGTMFVFDDVVSVSGLNDVHRVFNAPRGFAISPDGTTLYYVVLLEYQQAAVGGGCSTGSVFTTGTFPVIRKWDLAGDVDTGLVINYDPMPFTSTYPLRDMSQCAIDIQHTDTTANGDIVVTCNRLVAPTIYGPLLPPVSAPTCTPVITGGSPTWPIGDHLFALRYAAYDWQPCSGVISPFAYGYTTFGPTTSVHIGASTVGHIDVTWGAPPNINTRIVGVVMSSDGGTTWTELVLEAPNAQCVGGTHSIGIPTGAGPVCSWEQTVNFAVGYFLDQFARVAPVVRGERITPAGAVVATYTPSVDDAPDNRLVGIAINEELTGSLYLLTNRHYGDVHGVIYRFALATGGTETDFIPVLIHENDGGSEPAVDLARVVVGSSGVTAQCPSTLVVTGTGLDSYESITVTDPSGASIGFSVISATYTELIIATDDPMTAGQYCVQIDDQAPLCVLVSCAGETFPICRRRRFPLPFDQNKLITIYRIAFLIQSGVSPNAGLTARFSRDGGNTFPLSRSLTAGAMGDYGYRVYTTNLGQGRNWVCELTTSEPYFWALIGCYADIEEGTS